MRAAFALLAMCAAVAACSRPNAGSETPPGVSYRINNGNLAESNERAAQYCGQYGKTATLDSVSNESGGGKIAVYSCQ
ncbi:MAG TPA: hypothetical protein VFA50_07400 [Stellaceae bacterium]|nr:hypothetical protein [Stellaceae bacterium]